MTSSRSRRAFTLIELLVVIAILGILMALLVPAVSSAMYTAKKGQAKNDAVQIAQSIIAYESEYGRMPDVDGTDANTAELLNILSGQDDENNPREIVFLEVPRAKQGKNGAQSSGSTISSSWKDPWGEDYEIRIDTDYEGELTAPDGNTIRKKVLVWSQADSKKTKDDTDKFVKSWE